MVSISPRSQGFSAGLPFSCIVKVAAPEYKGHVEERRCPDRFVGRVSQLEKMRDWAFAAGPQSLRRLDGPCILLVMESPHKDEFGAKWAYSPWPANGPTGRRVRRFAHALTIGLPEGVDPGLVLVNAVPYQCSLGLSTRYHRDKVFRAAWRHGGREFFQRRLARWYRQGDVIVNACTKGTSGVPLRIDVEDAIREALPDALYSRRPHPFRWMNTEMVNVEWTADPRDQV